MRTRGESLKTRYGLAAVGALLLIGIPLGAGQYLTLADLIQTSLEHNPAVSASAFGADAAQARVPQAKAPPDPTLRVGAMSLPVDTFRLDREPMTQLSVGVSQQIPYPGKLGRMGKAQEYQSQAAAEGLEADRQELVAAVRSAYYNVAYLDQAVAVTGRNKELMESLARIAEAKYSVGLGIQQDVLKAHVESYRMSGELISYQTQRDQAAAELGRLTADPKAPIGPAAPPGPLPPLPDRDRLLAAVREHNALLLAARREVSAAGEDLALSHLAAKPDPTVSVSYGIRQDTRMGDQVTRNADLLSAEVEIPLPVWKGGKQDLQVVEKVASQKVAQALASDQEARLVAQADQTLAEARGLSQRIALLQGGMIPEARMSLEAARAGYQTSKVDFMALLDNQLTLHRLELQLAENQAGYLKALAELDRLTGKPIEEILAEVKA
jgi:outer membrane protein, heavy metal efflux system